jgi:hypothetical protein
MDNCKTGIVSYLFSQKGILPYMMERYSSLGTRIAAWMTGEKPILIIGGEPGNGKSLLMGELVLRYNELAIQHRALRQPLILISYDQIHYLFLKRLSLFNMISPYNFLPKGETHPEARIVITRIIWHVLLFALQYYSLNVPIIVETPLIDHRGEDLIRELASSDLQRQMQVFIMHSPVMRMRSFYDESRQTKVSAHPLAMQRIHEVLLHQRGIAAHTQEEQDQALARSWERWLSNYEGMLLSWNPDDNKEGFSYTKELLEAMHIRTDPLSPALLEPYAHCVIELALKALPDLEAFVRKVQEYGADNDEVRRAP